MTIRTFLSMGAVAALAACQPAVPDSGAGFVDPGRGVGFDDPSTLAAREARRAQLEQGNIAPPRNVAADTLPPATTSAVNTVTRPTPSAAQPRTTSARAVSDPQGLDAELAQIARQNDASAAAANSGQQVVNASPSKSFSSEIPGLFRITG
ncbi:MAG: hypothetical protein AAFY39_01310, partial [Pseudomonadota bacterium]